MADDKADKTAIEIFVKYVDDLISAAKPPTIPAEFSDNKHLQEYHSKCLVLRETIAAFSSGDLSTEITARGFVAGCCKALQAHLRHLTWQAKQVENGDFSQHVDFLGEFSDAFNSMVDQLQRTMKELKAQEATLKALNHSLQEEVEQRNKAVLALQESEEKFKRLAQYDPLTGVFNRRSFFSLADMEIKSSLARGSACCLCILDIDYFKVFNDTYGHLAGDDALKHVVEVAKTVMRQSDIMGRYGGEEFIFLFPGNDLNAGLFTAERIRSALEKKPILLDNGKEAHISASIGISVILPEWLQFYKEDSIHDFLAQADEALYKSKALGRNKVTTATPHMPTPNLN